MHKKHFCFASVYSSQGQNAASLAEIQQSASAVLTHGDLYRFPLGGPMLMLQGQNSSQAKGNADVSQVSHMQIGSASLHQLGSRGTFVGKCSCRSPGSCPLSSVTQNGSPTEDGPSWELIQGNNFTEL